MAAIPLNINVSNAKIALNAGATYSLSKQTDLRGCSLYKVGQGANPIINYVGGPDSGAFTGSGELQDIDGNIAPNAYLWNGNGTFKATSCNVRGDGGITKGTPGGSVTLLFCRQADITTGYSVFLSGCVAVIDHCRFEGHSVYQSQVRIHLSRGTTFTHNYMSDAGGPKASLRMHDSTLDPSKPVRDYFADNEIHGDAHFGPIPTDLVHAKRIYDLTVINNLFDTGDFAIEPGILKALFKGNTIKDRHGGACVDCPMYTNYDTRDAAPPLKGAIIPFDRPASVVTWDSNNFSHQGGTGRLFSDPRGEAGFTITGKNTFNNQPVAGK